TGKGTRREVRVMNWAIGSFAYTYLRLRFPSTKDGKFIDSEVTIYFFITNLAQPFTLDLGGCENICGFVGSVPIFFGELIEGSRAAILLFDGVTRRYTMIFEQINIELRGR